MFDDPAAARAEFRADRVVFGATGGGGVRTSDYYGWAVASRRAVERIWGDAGLELVRWRPSGELFQQALAVLVRTDDSPAARAVRGPDGGPGTRYCAPGRRRLRRARARVPAPVVAGVRRVRGRRAPLS